MLRRHLMYSLSRCEYLVPYRIMYGNRVMKVQRRNILLLVQTTLKLFLGVMTFVGVIGIKLNN